jgi:glutamine amidotransferase
MAIVVVDYDMGNVGSIINMMKKIGHPAVLSRDPAVIESADRLILPGVGHFDNGMEKIRSLGLLDVLNKKVLEQRTPTLGICLGMQLLGERSAEGNQPGLGWIPAESIRFQSDSLRVPHMGWNTINPASDEAGAPHWLFADLPDERRFYFVHSYHVVPKETKAEIASCRYGTSFCAAVARDHILGVQFHPEKSHKFGMQLLRNFASHSFC